MLQFTTPPIAQLISSTHCLPQSKWMALKRQHQEAAGAFWLIVIAYRHGLRASEVCDLQAVRQQNQPPSQPSIDPELLWLHPDDGIGPTCAPSATPRSLAAVRAALAGR